MPDRVEASTSKQPHLSNQDLSKSVVENLDALSPEVISKAGHNQYR